MFPHGQHVERDRRQQVASPHNPGRTVPASTWDGADTISVPDAWVGDMSISASRDPARSLTTANVSLYCPASADIKRGDRIRSGEHTYNVPAVPIAPVNPFTGWASPIEIPLEEATDA